MNYRVALLLLGALAAVGCAGPRIKDPSAHVVGVRLIQQTDEGARVEITVALDNTNSVPLPLTRSNCTISVTGGGVYSASDHPTRTIPAAGHQDVVIPAVFATHNSLKGANFSIQGNITYEPPGAVRLLMTQSMIPLPTAGFAATGKVE